MKVEVKYAQHTIYICKKNLKQVKETHQGKIVKTIIYFPKLNRHGSSNTMTKLDPLTGGDLGFIQSFPSESPHVGY